MSNDKWFITAVNTGFLALILSSIAVVVVSGLFPELRQHRISVVWPMSVAVGAFLLQYFSQKGESGE